MGISEEITAQGICNIALEIFNGAPRSQNRDGERRRHLHVDFQILKDDIKNMNWIRPAIMELAARVPEDVVFLDLRLPLGVEMAAKAGAAPASCIRFLADSQGHDFMTSVRFDTLFELS